MRFHSSWHGSSECVLYRQYERIGNQYRRHHSYPFFTIEIIATCTPKGALRVGPCICKIGPPYRRRLGHSPPSGEVTSGEARANPTRRTDSGGPILQQGNRPHHGARPVPRGFDRQPRVLPGGRGLGRPAAGAAQLAARVVLQVPTRRAKHVPLRRIDRRPPGRPSALTSSGRSKKNQAVVTAVVSSCRTVPGRELSARARMARKHATVRRACLRGCARTARSDARSTRDHVGFVLESAGGAIPSTWQRALTRLT